MEWAPTGVGWGVGPALPVGGDGATVPGGPEVVGGKLAVTVGVAEAAGEGPPEPPAVGAGTGTTMTDPGRLPLAPDTTTSWSLLGEPKSASGGDPSVSADWRV